MNRTGWTGVAIASAVTIALVGCANMHGEKDNEDEVKMSINDVPAPVRDTLHREAGSATITTVDKEQKNGQDVYETDVKIDGKNWEIKVAADGKLLKKEIDEEDEKSEKSVHH